MSDKMPYLANDKKVNKRSGSTLLLSLLVLAAMLALGSSVGQLAIVESALTRANDDTVVATYAAESGLEQGAYRSRISGDTTTSLGVATPVTLANSAKWSRTATSTQGAMVLLNLPKNLTRGFDFYYPDSGSVLGNKESVKISIDHCGVGAWIELGYVQFTPGVPLGDFQKFRYPCSGNNQTIYNNTISSNYAYRFYIRYVTGSYDALDRVTIVGCAGDNGVPACDMPGVINLSSTATYRNSTRQMNLVLPRMPPVSGVFDYGVFSECQLIKDPNNPTPSC